MNCSICSGKHDYPEKFTGMYPNLVCRQCDSRAINAHGDKAQHHGCYYDGGKVVVSTIDNGDNPVYIEGIKCWRRYRFGGYVTMRDDFGCADIMEFYERHGMF